ncbi:hypothetical protein [Roseivivax jejudonensis]|uniref:hypothetical protein n=1 Tax=Roseivivax jejudonensis TaxID=1529041 RepID=UPI001179C217|nr:hypothetical protein [Roseivivax jejudonensis]
MIDDISRKARDLLAINGVYDESSFLNFMKSTDRNHLRALSKSEYSSVKPANELSEVFLNHVSPMMREICSSRAIRAMCHVLGCEEDEITPDAVSAVKEATMLRAPGCGQKSIKQINAWLKVCCKEPLRPGRDATEPLPPQVSPMEREHNRCAKIVRHMIGAGVSEGAAEEIIWRIYNDPDA